ncbi:MAG: calcium-binding protein [Xenococcaceae cyanobacterium MO_207.B15]|nr:calcium-binding protein [Xenococcaceae cyanobacterium MO_207.B15]
MTNLTNVIFLGTPGDDNTTQLFTEFALEGNDILEGDDGNDTLRGFNGQDQIKGEVGDDLIDGGAQRDSLFGGVGDDLIFGGSGDDSIEGGADNDRIFAGTGNDLIYGDNAPPISPTPSDEFFVEGNDFINAGAGDDIVFGQGGDDTVVGARGNDLINGGLGDDLLRGGLGEDTIRGSQGNDVIFGGRDNDEIFGGLGEDTIVGGAGSDTLTGGAGADIFVFQPNTDLKNFDIDVITDFNVNEDKIDLSAFALNINGNDQFAFDDFSNGLSQGLENAFFQVGSDVYIGSRPELGYNLGSLAGTGDVGNGLNESSIIIENINIDDLGNANFIFPGETPAL